MERLADFHIVPAGPSDCGALARVHVRSWRETYLGLLPEPMLAQMSVAAHTRRWARLLMAPEPPEFVLCAEGVSGLVGYCSGFAGAGRAEVSTLYILGLAQNRGLGQRLLSSMARVLAAREARSLRLWVLDGNQRARGFYERLGGKAGASRPVNGWGGGFSETVYVWPDIDALTRLAPRPA